MSYRSTLLATVVAGFATTSVAQSPTVTTPPVPPSSTAAPTDGFLVSSNGQTYIAPTSQVAGYVTAYMGSAIGTYATNAAIAAITPQVSQVQAWAAQVQASAAAAATDASEAQAAAGQAVSGGIPASAYNTPNGPLQLDAAGTASAALVKATSGATARTVAAERSDVIYAADYGLQANLSTVGNLTFASGGFTVSSSSYTFTQADVGKLVIGAYQSAVYPAGYSFRTITSVAAGVATVNVAWGTASIAGTTMQIASPGDAPFAAMMAQEALYQMPPCIVLPAGQMVFANAIDISPATNFCMRGQGTQITSFDFAGATDGIVIAPTSTAPQISVSDFTVQKLTGANLGTRLVGRGLYIGSTAGTLPVTTVRDISVNSVYTADGWYTNFEFENPANMHAMHLRSVGTATKDEVAADVVYPGSTNTTWGPTAVAGRGTSFYIHGSNTFYATDSTFENLISLDNNQSVDLANYQGMKFLGCHFINGWWGFREMPGYNNDTDEDLTIMGSLIQAYDGPMTFNQSTQTEIVGDTVWGYGNSTTAGVPNWTGLSISGISQNFTVQGINFANGGSAGTGIYDQMNGGWPHTLTGNAFGSGTYGIYVAAGAANAIIDGNSFNGVSHNISVHGQAFLGVNSGGDFYGDGLGNVRVVRDAALGVATVLQPGTNEGWSGRILAYIPAGSTLDVTHAGAFPVPASTTDQDTGGVAAGGTSVTVPAAAAAADWVGGSTMQVVDTARSPNVTATVTAVNTTTGVLTVTGLTGAIQNGDALTNFPLAVNQFAEGLSLDNAAIHLTDLFCHGNDTAGAAAVRFDADVRYGLQYYGLNAETSSLQSVLYSTSSGGSPVAPIFPAGFTVTILRGALFGEGEVAVDNGTTNGLYCSAWATLSSY